jgi:phosphohistidine phosphatase SixA
MRKPEDQSNVPGLSEKSLGGAFENGVPSKKEPSPIALTVDDLAFFRHALSAPARVESGVDLKITEAGIAQLKQSVVAYQKQISGGTKPIEIYASPALRTRETAEVIATELGLSKESIKISDHLAEGVQSGDVSAFIQQQLSGESNGGRRVIIVSHDPVFDLFFKQIVKGEGAKGLHRLKEGQYCTFTAQGAAFGPNPRLGDAAGPVCAQQ